MKRYVQPIIACSLLTLAFVFLLSGCNTIEGAGEDIESAGDAVQDAAD